LRDSLLQELVVEEITAREMTDEFFFHYTSIKGGKEIVLENKLLPVLSEYGDGVHLTTLGPALGMDIVRNNFSGVAGHIMQEFEAYFEIQISSSRVRRANDKRDIQVYPGSLQLSDYKWSLRRTEDSEMLATEYMMISCGSGGAREEHSSALGRYRLLRSHLTRGQERSPVYEQEEGKHYLYLTPNPDLCDGDWIVSDQVDMSCQGFLQQSPPKVPLPSPSRTIVWEYTCDGGGWKEDPTLKVYPVF